MTPNPSLRFSVLVACYNHEQYLAEALGSVWAQTYRDFEIVAVDDGSRDGTGRLLDDLSSRSPVPMHVIHTENAGASNAFNLAASYARGEYLAFLNDDDGYEPDRLAAFGRASRIAPGEFWGFSGVQAIDSRGQPIDERSIADARGPAIRASARPIEAALSLARFNTTVSSGNLVLSSGLFRRLGGFLPYAHIHDWDLALRLLWTGLPSILERRLYRYRVHGLNTFDPAPAADEVQSMWESRRRSFEGDLDAIRESIKEARDEPAAGRDYAAARLREIESSRGWRYLTRYRALRTKIVRR